MSGPCKHDQGVSFPQMIEGAIHGRCSECGRKIVVHRDGSVVVVADRPVTV